MHPKHLSILDFNYHLPHNRIAEYPLTDRDASKLLIYRKGDLQTDIYRNISKYIPDNSFLLFNNTKVVEARLLFQKPTGGVIELFCLEPDPRYITVGEALQQHGRVYWECLVGGASKWKNGQVLMKTVDNGKQHIKLEATYIEKRTGSFLIEFSWSPSEISFAEILHHAGAIPLPPYIKRKAEASDAERYQTVYAHFEGSVAAPTAGLHFTDHIFQELQNKNIDKDFVTLHVGAGTFKPVKTETMQDHEMHAEFIDVNFETIERLLNNLDKTIIPVGTTSLRTIESLYWLGVKWAEGETEANSVNQWEPYDTSAKDLPAQSALEILLQEMKKKKLTRILAKTQIIIAPGYRFRIAKGLITNFHQPQSTLLLLVAALIGTDWKKVYQYAMENEFRFLSYGDGCLLLP